MPALKRLVYFSPVLLNSPAQRPHHFVEWFRDRFKAEVLWVEPYPTRLPRWNDVRNRLAPISPANLGPSWMQADWLHILRVSVLPIEPLTFGRMLNGFGYQRAINRLTSWLTPSTLVVIAKPSELAYRSIEAHINGHVLYDVMDHMHLFSQGRSSNWILRKHQDLVRKSDRCWVSSKALRASVQAMTNSDVTLVPNAATLPVTDHKFVQSHRGITCAERQLVIGYVGSIAPWMDWDRIIELALAKPTARFELVGPVHTSVPRLPPNVILKPAVPQNLVYEVIKGFDIGLIPFKCNKLTEAVDPVKFYEYRACKVPVLSTRFGEMKDKSDADGVWFFEDLTVDNVQNLIQKLNSSTDHSNDFLLRNHWGYRFDSAKHTLPGWADGLYNH